MPRSLDPRVFSEATPPGMVSVRKGWWGNRVRSVPTEEAFASLGGRYDPGGGAVQGSGFSDAVIRDAVAHTHALGARPSHQAELAAALDALRAQLAALPADKRPVAEKAAESAREVVDAARPGGDDRLFRGAARSLRGWAEDIGGAAPAVAGAAERVIGLAGQVRGWTA